MILLEILPSQRLRLRRPVSAQVGWNCSEGPKHTPAGDVCTAVCGDGLVVPGQEDCDDQNNADKDGRVNCKQEHNWMCFADVPVEHTPSPC